MVVGYALGNRSDQENDILVLGEDEPNVITYSSSLLVNLSRACVPTCPYCSFQRKELISVPYSTIKISKSARQHGVREVVYTANSRPDQYSQIRSVLELWGFDSYVDYLYTACELGFLEGLIPVIQLGFLTPAELRQLSDVAALVKVSIDTSNDLIHESLFKWSARTRQQRRLKNLEWASKLKFPTIVSYTVSAGDRAESRKSMLEKVAQLHEEFGMIHEVVIDPFTPVDHVKKMPKQVPTHDDILKAFTFARSILPDDIPVIVPVDLKKINKFIKAGVRDIGSIVEFSTEEPGQYIPFDWEALHEKVSGLGYQLQQRFPLRRDFIFQEKYSKKLGQVFDSYRYKIKKEAQEKQKEAKG